MFITFEVLCLQSDEKQDEMWFSRVKLRNVVRLAKNHKVYWRS